MRQISREILSSVAILALAVCLGFVAAGCGGQDDESASSGTSAAGTKKAAVEDEQGEAAAARSTSDEGKSTMTVKGEDGTSTTIKQTGEGEGKLIVTDAQGNETVAMEMKKDALPTGFPEDFPVYKGKVASSSRTEGGDAVSYSVQIETPDSVGTVSDWYKKALPEKGYKVTTTMTMGDTGDMVAFEKDKSSGMVSIAPGEGKTDVVVSMTGTK